MGAASAGVQSPQSSMPAGKGAGASPSTPAGSTISATSGQPTMGAPNTNSNTGLGTASAGKGGGSSYATPTSPYIAEPQSFRNVDASGNPVTPMQVPNQYSNTIGAPNEIPSGTPVPTGASGKGAAAGGSQGKGPQ